MGLNAAARLTNAGTGVKKADLLRLPIDVFHIVRTGPTKHPRGHLPPDPELVEHIKLHGIPCDERRFVGKEDGDRIELIGGCRRTVAGLVAQAWLQKHRPNQAPLERDKRDPEGPWVLYAEVELREVSGIDLVLERVNANVSRGLPDSPSVLAAEVKAIVKMNRGAPDADLMRQIVAAMPRGVTAGVVSALSLWDNLAPELQARFESGEAPIGLLVPVMAARAEEREALLTKLLASGVRTAKGATRARNEEKDKADPWARRMSPRKMRAVADALTDEKGTALDDRATSDAALYVACGLRLAAGHDVPAVLKQLPKAVRREIEAARTAKKGRAK
mgnify:CR=1 FL=1